MEYALIGCFEDDNRPNIEILFESSNIDELFIIRDLINELDYSNITIQTFDIFNYLKSFMSFGDEDCIPRVIMVQVIKYKELFMIR